jgi:hypothetical protein
MTTTIKILGICDDRTDCECCGKSNLKRTVALDFDGGVRYYGTDCAAMAVMGKKTAGNKKVVEHRAMALSYGASRLDKWTPEQVARAIWNKFGYLTEVKPGRIVVAGAGEIPIG